MQAFFPILVTGLFVVLTPGLYSGAGAAEVPARADDASVFPRVDPAAAGVNLKALEQLKARAEATKSDAVVIVKDGKLVADWNFGQPRIKIEAMSATKSIVSLGIGRLVDMGKIKSVEQPVWDFYPEWNQGRKRKIMIRHLLNHTSGLQHEQDGIIYERPDFVRLALAAELTEDPGSKFSYNNKATNLLAGIIERASGKRMDRFIADEIFAPMGITDFRWSLDKAGNPHGMAGLEITAIQSTVMTDSKPRVIEARGYLGQMLTILPDSRIVAVRQRQGGATVDPKKLDEYFSEFWGMVEALVLF